MSQALQATIDQAWEQRTELSAASAPAEVRDAVNHIIDALDTGKLRVAEKINGAWETHQWIKKAVLLSFRLNDNVPMGDGPLQFYDKVPTKYAGLSAEQLKATGVRVVPPAVARRGSFQAKNVILMPSYVNIGAYVDEGTMVDTWATVGSCAQIGKNVHLSGGVGIGGVLEPAQAAPVIIGDEAMIGSRCMVTQGARVGEGSVLAEGCVLNPSIPVIDAETGEELSRGYLPPWTVGVQATRPRTFAGGAFGMPCVLVIRHLTEGERHDKAKLNDALRESGVNVG